MTKRVKKPVYVTRRKLGRKSKLTRAVLTTIEAHKGECLTDRALARIVNVHPDTFSEWKRKAAKAKTGMFYLFNLALHEDAAAADTRILNPWMKEVDKGNIRAIELALKRHPRLRAEFKETPLEVEQAGAFEFKVEFVPVRSSSSSSGFTLEAENVEALPESENESNALNDSDAAVLLEEDSSSSSSDDPLALDLVLEEDQDSDAAD